MSGCWPLSCFHWKSGNKIFHLLICNHGNKPMYPQEKLMPLRRRNSSFHPQGIPKKRVSIFLCWHSKCLVGEILGYVWHPVPMKATWSCATDTWEKRWSKESLLWKQYSISLSLIGINTIDTIKTVADCILLQIVAVSPLDILLTLPGGQYRPLWETVM